MSAPRTGILPRPKRPVPWGPGHKPRPLPLRKPVTIAIGMLAHDGLVIASDTQETSQNFMKTDVAKTRYTYYKDERGRSSMIVTGAGRGSYVDALGNELMDWFGDDRSEGIVPVQDEIQRRLRAFYAAHVEPFKPDRPDFSMIVGVERHDERAIFVTDLTSVREIHHVSAIGIGELYASNLLHKHVTPWLRFNGGAELAARVAAYVIYKVKEVIDTCGSFTQVLYTCDGQVRSLRHPYVRELEGLFPQFDDLFADAVIAAFKPDAEPHLDGELRLLQDAISKMRRPNIGD